MTHVFKSVLLFAVIAAGVAQAGTAVAQRVGTVVGQTRTFDGDLADVLAMPAAAPNTVDAFYDFATGDVIVNLGTGISLLGIVGESILGENLTTDSTVIGFGPGVLPAALQNDEGGVGFFAPAGLVLGDDFRPGAAGGPHNLGSLLPAGLDGSDFDQFSFDAFGQSNVFLSYGLTEAAGGGAFSDGFQVVGGESAIIPPVVVPPVVVPPVVVPPVTPPSPPVDPRVGTTIGETRAFAGTRADVDAGAPLADSIAQAFYDPANGEVIVSLGPGLSLLGFNGEAFLGENLTTDSTVIGFGPGLLPAPAQNDGGGIGFFAPSGLILGDDFRPGAAGGPYNLGSLLPPDLDVVDFDQFGFDEIGQSSVFLTYGLTAAAGGGTFHDGLQIIGGTNPPVDLPVNPPTVDPPVNPPTEPPVDPPSGGQRIGTTVGDHVVFAGDPDDVAAVAPNTVEAFYDSATGEIIVYLGSGISLLGLNGESFLGENLTTDSATIGFGPGVLPAPSQNDSGGIGFFAPSGLVLGDDFQPGAAGGPFNLGALLPPGLNLAGFDQFGFDAGGQSMVFLSYGLTQAAGGGTFNTGLQIVNAQAPTAIPEPGSLALLFVGGLSVVARRRRQ